MELEGSGKPCEETEPCAQQSCLTIGSTEEAGRAVSEINVGSPRLG